MLSVPGHKYELIRKGASAGADCIMLDLQDAVPPEKKAEGRSTIRRALEENLFAGRLVTVRVNDRDSGLTEDDIQEVACSQLNGFVYPMADSPDEIRKLDAQLDRAETRLGLPRGQLALIILIETPLGVINVHQITGSSPRIVALVFGAEDYLVKMRARHDAGGLSLLMPRAQIALAARAAGIEAIDTPYLDLEDPRGLLAHAETGRALGMSGMLIISPRQIATVHSAYSPSPEEIASARAMVQLAEQMREAGHGYAVTNHQLVSPSKEKEARATLARAATIQNHDGRSEDEGRIQARDEQIGEEESPMTFGRYYEDFEVGTTIKHYPGRTISESDNLLFCMLTMNHHPLHIDAEFAARTQHGRPLVVGTLVFSLVVGLTVADISGHAIANLEYSEVKHLGPTFYGDTVYAETKVLDKRESRSKPDRGIVHVETTAHNQRGEPVLRFQRRVLVPKRVAGPSAAGTGS
jgi:citrate lyase beta subunit/acyl dehydratase